MADPVGFAASVLTLTDAAAAVVKFIQQVRHCPDQVKAFVNEINDLRYVLEDVEDLHNEKELGEQSRLGPVLERANDAIEQIDQFVKQFRVTEKGKLAFIDRVRWSIAQQKKAEELKQRLINIRSQLSTLIQTSTEYVPIPFANSAPTTAY